ncbi:MAG: serine hydrolase [Spirochaetota bacterium]
MIRTKMILAGLLVLLITALPGYSQSTDETEALTELFELGPEALSYTDQFSNAVSTNQLNQINNQIISQVGSFIRVEGEKNPYTLIFEKGTATVHIVLDRHGKIAGLQFTAITPAGVSIEQAVEKITDLGNKSAVLIRRNGKTILARNAKEPLAVASSFKLAVLAALEDTIDEDKLFWDQPVELQPEWKSLPTGILQDWPDYSSLTIETLATLMISISDNTATDALISLIGRNQIESHFPKDTLLLTTAEAFKLKNPDNKDLLNIYRKGSDSEKRSVLESLSKRSLPGAELFTGDPVAADIEWFMTAEQLADLLERVQPYRLMTINAGLAAKSSWKRVAYKGGSEPGVLSLNTFLISQEGTSYTVSVTVNNEEEALDETGIYVAYQGILNALE